METYYRTAITYTDTLCFCAENEAGEVCGFILGPLVSAGFHKKLILANKLAYGWTALKIICTRPKALIRLKNNLDKVDSKTQDDGLYAEVALIGVLPSHQGQGIGKQLFKAFEKAAKSRGARQICLTTDYNDNAKVVAAYQAWGLAEWYRYIAYPNRKMYKMRKEI